MRPDPLAFATDINIQPAVDNDVFLRTTNTPIPFDHNSFSTIFRASSIDLATPAIPPNFRTTRIQRS